MYLSDILLDIYYDGPAIFYNFCPTAVSKPRNTSMPKYSIQLDFCSQKGRSSKLCNFIRQYKLRTQLLFQVTFEHWLDFTIFAEFDGTIVQIHVTSNGVIDSKWLQMESKNRSWWFNCTANYSRLNLDTSKGSLNWHNKQPLQTLKQ